MARKYQLQTKASAGKSGIDYSASLNEAQYQAVTAWPPGPAMVIAGAGSGKTRVLTYRVAWLLDRGIPPSAILLLTFTNKSAREMLERVEQLVPFDTAGLWGGTFHAVGNRILRRTPEPVGWRPGFSILDREDQKGLMGSVIDALDMKNIHPRFPKSDVVCDILSYAANTKLGIDEVLEDGYPYFAHLGEDLEKVAALYLEKKRATNSMDFDDLLVQALGLLRDNLEIRDNYQRRFQFILVDEFQDTNSVQAEFVDQLVGSGSSLMVVGDDAQSIYSWRGANCEYILDFPARYPGAATYTIETNYRSVPEVLALANASISHNTRQFPKNLSAARPPVGELPALVPLDDPRQQAAFVAERILELHGEGVPFEEIAVLYRAHFHALDLQLELTTREIPFRITSGLRFFEQAHIKDVAAFLRLIVNPQDEVAFLRLARMLPGIGNKNAEALWRRWNSATSLGRNASHEKIFATMKVPAKAVKDWQQLAFTLDELVVENGEFAKPSEAIKSVLMGVYDEWMQEKFTNYTARVQDLEQLMLFAAGHQDLEALLAELTLLSGVDVADGRENQNNLECVTLSSIHQAKGLEWRAVFVIWLTDSMFPNAKVMENDDGTGIEEERRLFYVATTRAKDYLHLCYPCLWPNNYTGETIQYPSCFIAELPPALMEPWEVS